MNFIGVFQLITNGHPSGNGRHLNVKFFDFLVYVKGSSISFNGGIQSHYDFCYWVFRKPFQQQINGQIGRDLANQKISTRNF